MITDADNQTVRLPVCRAACLFLILLLQGGTPVSAQPDADVVVIDPSKRPMRLGTVLAELPFPGAWWTDGYSVRFPGSGLSGPLGRPPVVVVDGLEMPIGVLDRTNPGLLPVSTFDIAAMSRSPEMHLSPGGRVDYGSIRLSTLMPEGTTLRGSVVLVNDTGDPGPDLYRSGGRNVDRSGPRASVRASVNESSWYVEGALDTDEHHMTDGRIVRRIWAGYDDVIQPVIRVFHPHGRIRYDSGDLLVDVRGGRAMSDDFMFLDPLAREWTNRQTRTWLSALAVRRIDANWTTEIATNGQDAEIESRSMPFEGPRPLSLRTGSVRASLTRSWPTGTTSLHAGFFSEDAAQSARFDRTVESRGFAGLAWHRSLSSAMDVRLDARVSHPVDAPLDPSSASPAVSLGLRGRSGRIRLSGGVSLSSEHRQPLSSLSELAASGFDVGELGSPIAAAPLRTRERIAEIHFRISGTSAGSLGAPAAASAADAPAAAAPAVTRWLEVRARRSQGLTVPDVSFRHTGDVAFRSSPRFTSGVSGRVWQIGAGVDWRARPSPGLAANGLRVRLAAYAYGTAAESDVFRNWFSGRPRYETRVDAGWSGRRIGLDLSGRIEGPRTWRMYSRTRLARRPAQTRIDAAVWKRIAGEAALFTLGVRNLLDTPYRVHPAGIDEQLSVRVGMTVRFNRTAR